MQVLKEEVRKRLLHAAMEEFANHGYETTSLRTIARHANVTPGNIYAYFQSKEAILDAILAPTLSLLHEQIALMSKGDSITSISFPLLASRITDLYLRNKKQFVILMTKAQGTKYALAKQSIIQAIQQRLLIDLFPLLPQSAQDPILALTIASALVEGLLTIFINESSEARVKELVLHLIQLLFMPLMHTIATPGQSMEALAAE